MKRRAPALLVIRMSSLGDLILSLAFLESLSPEIEVDWVVSSAFAFVLEGHPRIRKLIVFDKKTGIKGWFQLLKKTYAENYSARVDLHVTLRTCLARWFFFVNDLGLFRLTPWKAISKQRIRFFSYLTLKSALPCFLRPTPLWKRFAHLAGQMTRKSSAAECPPVYRRIENRISEYGLLEKNYYCLAPASQWQSKEWGVLEYVQLCRNLVKNKKAKILILGRMKDEACRRLIDHLTKEQIPFISALQEESFAITAGLIQNSIAYVGGDTGLAHLAEAVNTPAVVIFGPTRPDLGFGPRSLKSISVFSDVLCSPCSKDGRFCYRLGDPYACLSRISCAQVLEAIEKVTQA